MIFRGIWVLNEIQSNVWYCKSRLVLCAADPPGSRFNMKTAFARYGIPVLKIRRSRDHLICNMKIPIVVRRHLYIETAPWSAASPSTLHCAKLKEIRWFHGFVKSHALTSISIIGPDVRDDRTITETDTSSRWLPGLSLGALKLAFSASGDGWGGHPGDVSVSLMKSLCIHIYLIQCLNTLRPRQDGCLFADDILKCIFFNLNSWIPNKISWKYVA